jgi:hypothetical protein
LARSQRNVSLMDRKFKTEVPFAGRIWPVQSEAFDRIAA